MIRFPNAKINLGLNIVSKRDDGYHNLETIFYPIDIKDALEVVPAKEGVTEAYRFFQSGIPIAGDEEHNLVIKALKLVKQEQEIPPIDIYLHKAIPFGAGLGGGSANAAAMLHLLNDMFELKYNHDKLINLAQKLGADCPFFINNKPAFATGIGEHLEEVELDLSNYHFAIVKPDIWVSTADAYSMIIPQDADISLKEVIKMPVAEWKNVMTNDFEQPIFNKYPQICEIKEELYNQGAIYASMSGSGSSVFAIFDRKPNIEGLFQQHFVWIQ